MFMYRMCMRMYAFIHVLIYLNLIQKCMLIYLNLIRKNTQFLYSTYSDESIASISENNFLFLVYGKVYQSIKICVNDSKFHTPFRNGSSPLLNSETQFLHYIFSFFLLHRGKSYINLPSALRLSSHNNCS